MLHGRMGFAARRECAMTVPMWLFAVFILFGATYERSLRWRMPAALLLSAGGLVGIFF